MVQRGLMRLWGGLLVWLTVATLTFVITYLIPANPAKLLAGAQADPETVSRIARELGLDDPVWLRLGRYLFHALQGDWGVSYATGQAVLPAIFERFGATAMLAVAAMAVYVLVGGGLGVWAALRPGTWVDRLIAGLAIAALSIPTFWMGLVLLFLFAYHLSLFPLGGAGTLWHLCLPALTLGLAGAAYYTRVLRQSMTQELGKDYVRAARAKGVTEYRVVGHHVLRNALMPFVTLLGVDFANLLGGAVLTESVFAWPGIGQLAVQAIDTLDIPMIMGTVLFAATVIIVVNWIVDGLYVWLDPRLRHGS
jgi:ABC-type dipeptide/oligopeptide/nickel transport system permease component